MKAIYAFQQNPSNPLFTCTAIRVGLKYTLIIVELPFPLPYYNVMLTHSPVGSLVSQQLVDPLLQLIALSLLLLQVVLVLGVPVSDHTQQPLHL